MTLYDHEWLNGHFTLNSHLRTGFGSIIGWLREYFSLIYCGVCLHYTVPCAQRRSAGSGVANRDLQNIGIRGKTADLP